EIVDNMNVVLNGNESGLAGYWKFQEGNGSTTKDETSYKNDATVYSDWRLGWHSSFIKSQPQSQTLCEGQDAVFSVNAVGGNKTLTYQWYKDEQPISEDNRIIGSDSTVLIVNNIIKSDEGKYYVIVTGNPGNSKQSSDTIELKAKKIVTLQRGEPLQLIRVDDGGEMSLIVNASGENPISYRWYKNGLEIPGTNIPNLIKVPFTKQDEGRYYCYVSNQCNNTVSDTFEVLLNTTSVEDYNSDNQIFVFPNPFNGFTTIYLNLEKPRSVKLSVFDVLGNEIIVITNQKLEIGTHRFIFNAEGLSSGIYFYNLDIEGKKQTGLLNYIK
ncbi:MAG: immunoglobulin domain-containing protein, partial [Ignavibacteriae bacterium]|nr:immunoglobulin domain-containing protein [Ignavibacteriota bacterium]